MNAAAYFYFVETPELSCTWIGGPLKPSMCPGRVWLTAPGGRPVLEVPRSAVTPTTKEETAKRIHADKQTSRGHLN